MNTLQSLRSFACATLCAGLLTACSTGPDLTGVRSSAQASHPADTVKRSTTRATYRADSLSKAQATKLSNRLFDRYSLNKSSRSTTEAALRRSGKFKAPKTLKAGDARFVIYAQADGTRGGVTVVYNSICNLHCSVGIQNIGPNLYEGGQITRP